MQEPTLQSRNGFFVNPDTNDHTWYHGSWVGKIDRVRATTPRKHAYGATFYTSSFELAEEFASGERAWLDFYEDPPRMKRSGYVHKVKIEDVPLVDPNLIFTNKDEQLLSEGFGVPFVNELHKQGATQDSIASFLRSLSAFQYQAFNKSNTIWQPLRQTLDHLGYRGWLEKESIDSSATNIGLLYPMEDTQMQGGYIVKRSRKF